MHPREFLILAKDLQQKAGSAECRSATSRAYYSAFHSAMLWLKTSGLGNPVRREAHQKVPMALSGSGDPDLMKVSQWLSSLRGWRNGADYDLGDKQVEHSSKVKGAIQTAEQIADSLNKLQADPSRSANVVRSIQAWNAVNKALI